ncbi:MAG: tRNA dihydrouridine synthase DusB [Candidatus Omnitrophica bacterium]|nr:tRNA dihydrouridine synthase DusB [Candidatus Omnitrophota bacterium]
MLKIGTLELKSRLILAPMAGVTDLPFRLLARRFGCEFAFIEMLNVRSLGHKSRRTLEMLTVDAQDRPLGVQILGKEPGFILKGLDVLRKYKFELLDFNSACPARKVVRRGEGAALMREPKKLQKLLKLIVKESPVPVTVKIRSGWDEKSINAREVALLAEDAGVSAVFIHGRTRMQEYGGNVEYGVIRKVKKALKIPLVASGDILSAQLAKRMFDETGCDGLAVARGALGNPWIFRQIEDFLKSGKLPPEPGKEEIVKVMLEHLRANTDFYPEDVGVMKFRRFFCCYTKGFRKVRPLREKVSRAKAKKEMEGIILGCKGLERVIPRQSAAKVPDILD